MKNYIRLCLCGKFYEFEGKLHWMNWWGVIHLLFYKYLCGLNYDKTFKWVKHKDVEII